MMPYPPRLLLQWHITERCNLRCDHCYQQNFDGTEMDFQACLDIVSQYRQFLSLPRDHGKQAIKGHINITGGEPFLYADIWKLLTLLDELKEKFSFAILTNGTLIDKARVRRLVEYKPRFVQVSIDGGPDVHDRIRGRGSYQSAVAGLKYLRRAGIATLISFTAHGGNVQEFPKVARLGRAVGAMRVWADRMVPYGQACRGEPQLLSPEQTRGWAKNLKTERSKAFWYSAGRTHIAMHRALQFLEGGGRPYHCTAGSTLLTVMPNGDVYPCRRMPKRVGSLFQKDLKDIYFENPFLQALRDPRNLPSACGACRHRAECRGGLRCLSYAVTGDPFQRDPGCWVI